MRTEYLLNREVERVLMLLTPSNRLALRVSLHTGLRISDVLALKTDQLSSRFWVTESKTGKKKFVGLPKELLADLRAIAGKIYVFPKRGKPAQHRTRQAVWRDLKRAAKAFRLPQNVGFTFFDVFVDSGQYLVVAERLFKTFNAYHFHATSFREFREALLK